MDPTQGPSAADAVNDWEERRLARVLRDFGEERYADRIARAIARERARAPITTTDRLVDVVTEAIPVPARFAGGHPAKRTFQGLRIAVNDELGQLDRALPAAWQLLRRKRPICRDLVPLPGRPAREAVPRGPRPGVHLPARPPRVRLRPHARGRAPDPQVRHRLARGGGRQPAREVGPAARRTEAREVRPAMTPPPSNAGTATAGRLRTGAAPRAPRRVSGPRRPPPSRRPAGRVRRRARPPRGLRPRAARRRAGSIACCAAARGSPSWPARSWASSSCRSRC